VAVVVLAAAGVLSGAAANADDAPAAPRFAEGAQTFLANCAVCHRATGVGQPGLAPPLTSYPARYIATAEGRRQLVLTALYGMFGEITVDERHFNFKMPDFSRFDDATLAAVLNFVVFDISHAAATEAPLQPEDVARERSAGLSGEAVRRHRAEVLGAPAS